MELTNSRFVIDASVCLKWYLRDETLDDEASEVLRHYARGNIELVAPSLLVLEFINGLSVAARKGRIAFNLVSEAVEELLDIRFDFRDATNLSSEIVRLCYQLGRSAYDAAYLAIAEREGIPLLTGDKRLYNALQDRLPWVLWLGAYPTGK